MVGTGKAPTPPYASQRHAVDIAAQPATPEACLLGPCFLERNEELKMFKDWPGDGGTKSVCVGCGAMAQGSPLLSSVLPSLGSHSYLSEPLVTPRKV